MRKIRVISLFLALLMLVCAIISSSVVAEETTSEDSSIISETVNAWPTEIEGVKGGGATAHGQNQTRLCHTATGDYISCPLGDYDEVGGSWGIRTEIGLWRLNEDKSIDFITKYSVYGMAAGTTSNVMADANGDIWVVSSWDEGSGFYRLYAIKYDVKTGEVSTYNVQRYAKKGNSGGGKPVSIMDATNNRIYQFGHGKTGKNYWLTWYILDCNTGEWSQIYQVKTPNAPTFYHYGYADGKGGFFVINETCDDGWAIPTTVDGLNAQSAVDVYHSMYQYPGYIWWNSMICYVPDATVAEGYCSYAIETPVDPTIGLQPNNWNVANDLYWDKETGYLYSITTFLNGVVPGEKKYLQVFDTNQMNADIQNDGPFKLISQTELYFLYGNTSNYYQHIVKDTTGQLYIVAAQANHGTVEVWKATNQPATEFQLVYCDYFHGALNQSNAASGIYGIIVATERNNSLTDDTARFITWSNGRNGWVYFDVDLAALRDYLK